MENNSFVKNILIVIGVVIFFVGICFFLLNYFLGKKIEIIKNDITSLQDEKPLNCVMRTEKYSFPYGNEKGISTQKAELKCLNNERMITGGCEVVGGSGAYADFGGVENLGYLSNRPNDDGNGWFCGFFGGEKPGGYDSKSWIDGGVWDLSVYVYCCEQ